MRIRNRAAVIFTSLLMTVAGEGCIAEEDTFSCCDDPSQPECELEEFLDCEIEEADHSDKNR